MEMDHNSSIMAVSAIIQSALTPVFLLTGIAGLLSVLTLRLARVVDRGRLLDAKVQTLPKEQRAPVLEEANIVWRRISLLNWAIRMSVFSALLVCVSIALLFIGDFSGINIGNLIGYFFITTMALMTLSFGTLMAEVSISTRSLRQKLEHLLVKDNNGSN